ncbi:MAG: dienelactone hydrolase family protein [Flavobacteriales bacterium]|nr:dienelactone hydrolase family protein [Flavobacteriales bacterium]
MKHNISITKTATYHTLGDVSSAKTIWFVLHGYGYSAAHFITKFEPILNEDIAIIAPEGLSKFYLNGVGFDGKVGASWMTKDDRENEIKDYVNYLNQLYKVIISKNSCADLKINILGFSQGGATASRWIANGQLKCNNFILWCSVFPDDMNFETISNINTYFLYGDNDKYVTEDRVAKQRELINNSGIGIKTTVFKGKHDVPEAVLVEQALVNDW